MTPARVLIGAVLPDEEIQRVSLATPTLHTARPVLRRFTEADADDLFALHSNLHVLRHWDSPPWSEPERAGRFIAACRHSS